MANKNRIRITYPSSEKIYIPGKIHKINVGMRKIKILDTVTRDENGELVHKKNKSRHRVMIPVDLIRTRKSRSIRKTAFPVSANPGMQDAKT